MKNLSKLYPVAEPRLSGENKIALTITILFKDKNQPEILSWIRY